MATSATNLNYVPATPTSYARPVQVEDATAGLCGAVMPNGKGCLVWPNSGGVHFAVTDSPYDWLVDDIVQAGDIGSVVADSSGAMYSSVFYLDGELWSVVVAWAADRGYVWLYQADSPTAPTSWSLYTTIQDVDSNDDFTFELPKAAGLPLRLDSGRWVLPCPAWENNAFLKGQHVGVWTSDDAGTSFTRRLDYSHASTGLPFTSTQSMQVAREPTTGYLYIYSGSDAGGVNPMILWESTDDGTSWSNIYVGGWFDDQHITTFIDNGTTLYSGNTVLDSNVTSLVGAATDLASFTTTGTEWIAPGASGNGYTFKAVVWTDAVFFFLTDQVMYTPIINQVLPYPPLHIPFKDRLKNVRLLDTT